MSTRTRIALGAAAWLAGALVLMFAPIGAYTATLATEVIILSLWAVSYNLVYGYMGEISFGHAAFFGLGAFGVPLLARDLNLPFALDLLGGMLVAGLFAAVVSFVIRRTRGVYYAVLTFALAEVVYVIAIKWTSFTGGDNGLPVARPALLNSPVRYALFALVVVTIAIAALHRIVNSPAGRVVQAVRQNERVHVRSATTPLRIVRSLSSCQELSAGWRERSIRRSSISSRPMCCSGLSPDRSS
jgi:branched-chain amino acid transport system permease protein